MSFDLSYLESLSPEEWAAKVHTSWTIKDCVAHLVGWERECARVLPEAWKSQQAPWFIKTDNYETFNAQNVEEYRSYTPEQLLAEWKKWQHVFDQEVEAIGEHALRVKPDLFGWVFDESHYEKHYDQIRKALR